MNVQEILDLSKQRKQKTKIAIQKIVENVHKKIKYYAQMKKESCVYIIPPIVNDIPLYDFEEIVKDVFKVLDTEGYIVTAYPNGQLYICWNEKLVEQKVKTDAFVLTHEEKKLKNVTKKIKKIDERFSFLANPSKLLKKEEPTLEEKIDQQFENILKEKDKQQKKYKKLVGNFVKL